MTTPNNDRDGSPADSPFRRQAAEFMAANHDLSPTQIVLLATVVAAPVAAVFGGGEGARAILVVALVVILFNMVGGEDGSQG